MICVALLLVLLMWLTLCMAFVSACFAADVADRDLEGQPADTAISREVAVRAVCVTCSIVLLMSVATRYTC